ncbi:MAG: zinc-dependent peptidase [Phycisphaerales bacterium]
MLGILKWPRRKRLRNTPLPEAWWTIIERRVPAVRWLTPDDRAELAGHIQILLHEKRFEGCAGLEITDEIRVTIAAQAALLLLHRDTDYYPTLSTILVYPSAYIAQNKRLNPDGSITEGPQGRLGESWFRGAIVLSWSDVLQGAADERDGHNVVLHEFAHQLDAQWGGMNGAPILPGGASYADWAAVLGHEYQSLINNLHAGNHTLLRPYAATNPAEFFAVATEFFFERPHAMRASHPALYQQLAGFYRQDPAARQPPTGA